MSETVATLALKYGLYRVTMAMASGRGGWKDAETWFHAYVRPR
ncbi:MAG: hypothetical protein VB050_10380 [Geobacteraceae bacterium]|nr:hypothetical protein [Geobacteraceae bacterium]